MSYSYLSRRIAWSHALQTSHSFPTRRSSVLGARPQAHERRRVRTNRRAAGIAATAGHPHEIAGLAHVEHGNDRQTDRKSTRLNSSHLVISYAVFCLKKKKTI